MLNTHICKTDNLQTLARFDFLDVCLLGETGTGKTFAAKLIHDLSPRFNQPFVAVNCAELSPSIIESELFGYEKGAFTGAAASKIGKFEAATGGTLFLDEIGELPANLQAKLLKVVEEKSITRVGGTRPHSVDVRIIYATHRDLSVLREDLRYRIAAHTVYLKPLRERTEEIVFLAQKFISEFSRRCGQTITATDNVLKILENFEWGGNVRELRSFIEKVCLAALFTSENDNLSNESIELTDKHLLSQTPLAENRQNTITFPSFERLPVFKSGDKIEDYLAKIETDLLKKAMLENNNNQTHAARELGISRGGLIKKLKRLSH